jgi:hypothetical protein
MQRQAYGFRDLEFFKFKIEVIHLSRYAIVGGATFSLLLASKIFMGGTERYIQVSHGRIAQNKSTIYLYVDLPQVLQL